MASDMSRCWSSCTVSPQIAVSFGIVALDGSLAVCIFLASVMSSVFSSDSFGVLGLAEAPSTECKPCKYCGRNSIDVTWTRGGNGLECKTCAGWLKYHFGTGPEAVKQRRVLQADLDSDPAKREQHKKDMEDKEQSGARFKRRKTVEAAETTALQGKVFLGNFWPKAIYEASFAPAKLSKAETATYDGQKGKFLGMEFPMVPGVIEVSRMKEQKFTATTHLNVDDQDVDGVCPGQQQKWMLR